mgnify:FL=1|tara:strand:- start:349 stop:588 length:240 start_codon:yes stop_codon:yes gene_type:complete
MKKRNILDKQTKKVLELISLHCNEMDIFNIDINKNTGINVLCTFDSWTVKNLIKLKFKAEIRDNGFVKLKRNILTITFT